MLISLVAFVLTFLGATLLNIAAGQPFTPAAGAVDPFLHQRPVRVALGLDQETPGLMRPATAAQHQSIMTRGVKLTSGLVGLYIAICSVVLIYYGTQHSTPPSLVDRPDGVRR